MQLSTDKLATLSGLLTAERKRQGLSREAAAAVCNVSISFIRDAEADAGKCSLAKLLLLINGIGLNVTIDGWSHVAESADEPATDAAGHTP